MPIDYTKSKIYAIRSNQTDKFWLGCTVKRLCERFSQHKNNYAKWLANGKVGYNDPMYEILQYNDAYIALVAKCDLKDKCELNTKLMEYISIFKDHCVNTTQKPKDDSVKMYKLPSLGKPRGRPRKVKVDKVEIETPVNTPA